MCPVAVSGAMCCVPGAIGAFYPFAGKDEAFQNSAATGLSLRQVDVNNGQLDFFQHLEMFVRAEKPPLCGRDHIMSPSASSRSPSECQRAVSGCVEVPLLPLPSAELSGPKFLASSRPAPILILKGVDGDLCEQFMTLTAEKHLPQTPLSNRPECPNQI